MRGTSLSRLVQVLIVVVSASSSNSLMKHEESELIDKMLPCDHDQMAEVNPYIVDVASQGEGVRSKRQLGYSNIRIHPVLTEVISSTDAYVQGNNSVLSRVIDDLQSMLQVHPVQGNLILSPQCTKYTEGLNEGKCMAPLPNQTDYTCGDFGIIPPSYIGTREVCNSSNSSCITEGPDGAGLPNADYLLFVSVYPTVPCWFGTLAYASPCVLDISDNNRPVVGYINICPDFLWDHGQQPQIIYGVFMHEIIHALGFTRYLFDKYVDADGNSYNPVKRVTGPHGPTYMFTGPKTVEYAKKYYGCDDVEGVYLENQGGSGTASSHWERRTLHHEMMNGYISKDYLVISEFTLALFEDSGWYKANYTALYNIKQNPLQWGKGLGCPFLTESCHNESAFPYWCDTSQTQLHCTYDHLTKGNCSTRWAGFDGCPVAVASKNEDYCRTKATVYPDPFQKDIESYGDSSVCANVVRSLPCSTLGMSLCITQETYTANGTNQYAVQIENEKYQCPDGKALVTNSSFIVLCPPDEEIISRSPSVLDEAPSLSSPKTINVPDLDTLEKIISSYENIVAFGEPNTSDSINIKYFINSKSDGRNFICQLVGCTVCTTPILVDDPTIILSAGILYTVAKEAFIASAVFTDSLTQSSDYTLVLMLDQQANHSFVYYAASVDFVGSYLKTLHSYDDYIFRVVALTNYIEIRIAPNQDININGTSIFHREEVIFVLNMGERVVVSSNEDLTGSRITANDSVSFYSGHYCATGKTTDCAILHEQLPPYNSWGNTFVVQTNINGLKGNMLKIVASDVGAHVSVKCTTHGTFYEVKNFSLGFRQYKTFSVYHDYCTVTSDENILILQFRDSSPPLMDTFMTIIPALVHYEDNYVFTAHEGFSNYIAITVKDTNVNSKTLLLNDSPFTVSWRKIELDGDTYYFSTLLLPAGRHKVAFTDNSVTFGVMLYGSNGNDAFAFPAGMKLNMIKTFPNAAPEPVENALVTVVGNVIKITWSPPFISNGEILQYIVQRVNSSGKSYHHVSGNRNYLELPSYSNALVFISAVNQYGQSSFEVAKSNAPCQPSPCVNNGICYTVYINDQYCDCPDSFYGRFCESTQKLYPFGLAYNDVLLPSEYGSSSMINLSEEIIFYYTKTKTVYVNLHGVITFDSPYTSPYIGSEQSIKSIRIIAPYWSGTDTRGTGEIFYRQTAEPTLLARASSEIQEVFPMSQNVTIKNLLIATWDAVGYYYMGTEKTNTFQCILASSEYESFAMFLYADMQWTNPHYHGALAGIYAGDKVNYVTIFGSRTSNIVNIDETSNIGAPGVWIFKTGEVCQPSIHTCASEFYPFGLTYGDTKLVTEDEGYSPLIYLSRDMYFYKKALGGVYINDNGVISFARHIAHSYRTPRSLPLSGIPFIAPYWADVDTREAGQIFYRQTTDPDLLTRASKEIQTALSLNKEAEIKHLLIATWNAVGYYFRGSDKVNTFQCILATSEEASFVMFLYDKLQWTTGGFAGGILGLGGTEALAGYNAGDGINSYTVDGSLTPSIVKLARTSNVGMPGTWIFKVGQDCFKKVVKDVVFVIDTSSRIGYYTFQLVRELTEKIATHIKVNSPETLFGLITFDEYARFEFNITRHTDLSTLLPAINPGLPYYGGYYADTADALNFLLSGGKKGGFLQLREKTSKLAIVITGSYSSSSSSLRSAANSLHSANIYEVYAIGIGGHSRSQLHSMASSSSFVSYTNALSNLTSQLLLKDIFKKLCFSNKPSIFLRPDAQQGTIGEPCELFCSVPLSSIAQSSLVNLTWNFISNDDRVTVIPTTITTDDSIGIIYTTVIQFAYLMEGDERVYKCIMETEEEDKIESNFYFKIIDPIIGIKLTADSTVAIYQPLTLQCNVTIVRGISSTVDIVWTTGDTQVRRVNNVTASKMDSTSVYNDTFIIPSLSFGDIGKVYQCEVLVNSFLPTTAKSKYDIGNRCSPKDNSTYDVVFVLDTSGSIGHSDFQIIRELVANITIELFKNYPNTSVGVIVFASDTHIEFNLRTYTSLSTLLLAINRLPYNDGGSTYTDKALTLLLSGAQSGILGLRQGSKKVAIIITDGISNNPSATLSAAAELHASNIFNVFTVGIGNAPLTELEAIASSAEFVFFVSTLDSAGIEEQIDKFLPELIHPGCNGWLLSISLQPSDFGIVGRKESLMCSLFVLPTVEPGTIKLHWINEGDIVTDDSRINVITHYNETTITKIIHFDPLAIEDKGKYTCYAIINESLIYDFTELQGFKRLTPYISLLPSGFDQNTVGQRQDVICSISVPPDVDPDIIELGWINEDDIITNDSRVTIVESPDDLSNNSSNINTSVIATVLRFDPLYENDKGTYSCFAIINESEKFASMQLQSFRVPLPFVEIAIVDKTSYSDNETHGNNTFGSLIISEPLTLDCTVTVVRGISSSVDIIWTTGGRELRRLDNVMADITNNSAIYTDSFEISSLSAIDNGREYQCTVVINAYQPVSSSDQITLIFPVPVCFNTTYCEGESVSDDLMSFDQCCFELPGVSFASSGQCLLCPQRGTCRHNTVNCVEEFYSFGLLENDTVLRKSVDSDSSVVLLQNFYFYNQSIEVVYVGDNGIISLNNSFNFWTPILLPLNGNRFIAPYWADVDLTGTGEVYYRQTTNPTLLARATKHIQAAFPFSQNVIITNLFIVTWDAVGYYLSGTNKTNTFQCVLATSYMDSFVIFLYADGEIQWTTGDSSDGNNGLGGREALAGINAGDGVNHITIPGSSTPSITNITQTSNVGIPGIWIFQVGENQADIIPYISLRHTDFYQNTVGQRQDVMCSISVPADVDPDTIELGWINEDDIITDDSRVTIVETPDDLSNNSSNINTSVITIVLRFDPLYEDDEGIYTCFAIIDESEAFASIQLQNFGIPMPFVQIAITNKTLYSDNETLGNNTFGNLIIGDPLTLDCTVTAVRGISSSVDIIWTTGGRVVRRVYNITADIEDDYAIYTDSFEISSLSAIDNGREYQCTVVINAIQPVYGSDQITLMFPDIDECLENNGNCSHDCINTEGSYYCECPVGYNLQTNKHECEDIDECLENNGNCSHNCVNIEDSYYCECPVGYNLQTNNHDCEDIDECLENNGNCSHDCVNTEGSYYCHCPVGYSLQTNKHDCEDIDECLHNNGNCSHDCINTEGSNYCECPAGYNLQINKRDCEVPMPFVQIAIANKTLDNETLGNNTYGNLIIGDPLTLDCIVTAVRGISSSVDIIWTAGGRVVKRVYNITADIENDHAIYTDSFEISSLSAIDNGREYQCTVVINAIQPVHSSDHITLMFPDIDECLENNGNCSHDCINIEGSYYCHCPDGYNLQTNKHDCEDFDECLGNSGNCSHDCVNIEGSYYCECSVGYNLQTNKYDCEDIDECLENNGNCSHDCINIEGSYYCHCPDGYNLQTNKHDCEDSDECLENNGSCSHNCVNTEGSYYCHCPVGYNLQTNKHDCEDIDECLDNNDSCSHNCVNIEGSYYCECPVGYNLQTNKYDCEDTDECLNNNGNCSHDCINTEGSYYCECPAGYNLQINQHDCEDTDECLNNNGNCSHDCINTEGSYYCHCPVGYNLQINKHDCEDINECLDNNDSCSHNCVNIEGSYYCHCIVGYDLQSNKHDCEDIDDCLNNNGNCSHDCINTEGSYYCECPVGYNLQANKHNCEVPMPFVQIAIANKTLDNETLGNNTYGNLIIGDPLTLDCIVTTVRGISSSVDIIWTAGGRVVRRVYNITADIENDHAIYTDSFEISSLSAIDNGREYQCTVVINAIQPVNNSDQITLMFPDIDECLENNGNCSHDCINTEGSYYCECPFGYNLRTNKHDCKDFDECLGNNGNCSHDCVNIEGSYYCECPVGYNLQTNKHDCEDFDECLGNNGNCSHDCVNIEGSYYCECPVGYNLQTNKHDCEDFDECLGNNGNCSHVCVNIEGSYYCECPVGYNLQTNKYDCEDIDECLENNGNCSHDCVNIEGSYYCHCPVGYNLQTNKHDCEDIDECLENNGKCSHDCVNIEGSYYCHCPVGYNLQTNKHDCEDIDECLDNNGNCSHDCINTEGSYYCECPVGYNLQSNKHDCEGTCRHKTVNCVEEFYPFGLLENDTVLRKSIDSDSFVVLLQNFYFYNQSIEVLYVGDNGIISLNTFYNSWTPILLPLNGERFVAPYWADVDLTGTGEVYYRQTTNPTLLARATKHIQAAFPFSQNAIITNLFIVTWDAVGYYSSGTNKTNTFQCLLATSYMESFVIFLYADGEIQWTTGDDSNGTDGLGGTEALAGINAGDGVNHITIPGSLTPSIINITQTSNIGIPGIWIFQVGKNQADIIPYISLRSSSFDQNTVGQRQDVLCSISVPADVDLDTIELGWINEDDIITDDSRVIIVQSLDELTSNSSNINTSVITTILRLDPLYEDDEGIYTCFAIIDDSEAFASIQLQNFGIPMPFVQITIANKTLYSDNETLGNNTFGNLIIGDPLTLDCTVTVVRGISSSIDIIWTTGGREVRRLDNIMADIKSDSAIYTDSFKISSLSAIDNGREYQCTVVINVYQPVHNSDQITLMFPDIDECLENNGNCSHDCVNTEGSYYCECPTGYNLQTNKHICEDIDECLNNNGNCSHYCINIEGSYYCHCLVGYNLQSNKHNCEDIDECLENNGNCSHDCINTEGSYYCECPIGYNLQANKHDCEDVDECLNNNGSCSHNCRNTEGSYYCECHAGYILHPNKHDCEDVNECLDKNANCSHYCINTEGSYYCKCPSGYILQPNKYECEDTNECLTDNGGCDHICMNTQGSFKCLCNTSYILAADNQTCVAIVTDCDYMLGGPSGYINTSGFPNTPYAAFSNCTWIIDIPMYKSIELKFYEMDIEESPNCIKDKVTILNGKGGDALPLGSYCGNKLPPIIQSSTEAITIQFVSDGTVNNKGFSLQYRGLKEQSKGEYGCAFLPSSNTPFGLSTFPFKYNGQFSCVYYFISPKGRKKVKLTFLYLDIINADCNKDRIDIYDGFTASVPNRRICNGNKVVEFISSEENVKMTYTGNSLGKYRGFHAVVTYI